jgi:hypothetical protein
MYSIVQLRSPASSGVCSRLSEHKDPRGRATGKRLPLLAAVRSHCCAEGNPAGHQLYGKTRQPSSSLCLHLALVATSAAALTEQLVPSGKTSEEFQCNVQQLL